MAYLNFIVKDLFVSVFVNLTILVFSWIAKGVINWYHQLLHTYITKEIRNSAKWHFKVYEIIHLEEYDSLETKTEPFALSRHCITIKDQKKVLTNTKIRSDLCKLSKIILDSYISTIRNKISQELSSNIHDAFNWFSNIQNKNINIYRRLLLIN